MFRNRPKLLFFSPLLIYLIINTNNLNQVFGQTVLVNLKTQNFSYLIDRRLAYDKVAEYSTNISKFDFNRIVHNKPAYIINNFFISIIKPFDFEKFSSPLQAHSPSAIAINNDMKLPKIFFFEIPLIFLGLITLIGGKNILIKYFWISLFWVLFFSDLGHHIDPALL